MGFEITTNVLLLAFTFAFFMGAISHQTNFCTMGAVSDWVNMGNTGRLAAWYFAIAVAIVGVSILESFFSLSLNTTIPSYSTANFAWLRYILGGLIFGVGMTLAGGCGSKTLINIGAGSLRSLVVLVAASAMAFLMTKTPFYEWFFSSWINASSINLTSLGITSQSIDDIFSGITGIASTSELRQIMAALLASMFLYLTFSSRSFRKNKTLMFSGGSLGIIVVAGWYVSGGPMGLEAIESVKWLNQRPEGVGVQSYTFINPMGELLMYLSAPTNTLLITYGVVALLGVVSGSFMSSLYSHNFKITQFTGRDDLIKHVVGGVLMGTGGVLAMGCTIGQGITGVSTLALGSLLVLLSIILSSAVTMKSSFYKMIYEEATFLACIVSTLVDFKILPESLRKLKRP